MNPSDMMKQAIQSVEQALVLVQTWTRVPTDPESQKCDARVVQGDGGGWKFVVSDFDISDQGFPPGSRGYDGAASSGATLVRLPRELSKRAFITAIAYILLNEPEPVDATHWSGPHS